MVVASSKSGGGACGGPHCVAHDAQEAMDAKVYGSPRAVRILTAAFKSNPGGWRASRK